MLESSTYRETLKREHYLVGRYDNLRSAESWLDAFRRDPGFSHREYEFYLGTANPTEISLKREFQQDSRVGIWVSIPMIGGSNV